MHSSARKSRTTAFACRNCHRQKKACKGKGKDSSCQRCQKRGIECVPCDRNVPASDVATPVTAPIPIAATRHLDDSPQTPDLDHSGFSASPDSPFPRSIDHWHNGEQSGLFGSSVGHDFATESLFPPSQFQDMSKQYYDAEPRIQSHYDPISHDLTHHDLSPIKPEHTSSKVVQDALADSEQERWQSQLMHELFGQSSVQRAPRVQIGFDFDMEESLTFSPPTSHQSTS